MTHHVKIDPEYFDQVETGLKTHELRKNDRNYQVGDMLIIREYIRGSRQNKRGTYTGRKTKKCVTHVLRGVPVGDSGYFGLAEGYVILSLDKYAEKKKGLSREDFPKFTPLTKTAAERKRSESTQRFFDTVNTVFEGLLIAGHKLMQQTAYDKVQILKENPEVKQLYYDILKEHWVVTYQNGETIHFATLDNYYKHKTLDL